MDIHLTVEEAAELLDLLNAHGGENLRGVANDLAEHLDFYDPVAETPLGEALDEPKSPE